MVEFYIDEKVRRKLVTKWIDVTMLALHLWATMLVLAIMAGRNSDIIAGMFGTVTFGIGATLVILLFDRAADAVISRITGSSPATKETIKTERTVETAPRGSDENTPTAS